LGCGANERERERDIAWGIRWPEYVARWGRDMKNAYKISVEKPEGKRLRRRHRWCDNIKM
jgi:hypothetical protein